MLGVSPYSCGLYMSLSSSFFEKNLDLSLSIYKYIYNCIYLYIYTHIFWGDGLSLVIFYWVYHKNDAAIPSQGLLQVLPGLVDISVSLVSGTWVTLR